MTDTTNKPQSSIETPQRVDWLVRWFQWYARRYLQKHFHAVRISKTGPIPQIADQRVLIVLNHPAWWDPMICIYLSRSYSNHKHFAPIDAEALRKYKFFRRLGFFGIERDTFSGARSFLRHTQQIFSTSGNAVWMTGQGHFTDPRIRPIHLLSGVGHLINKKPGLLVLPLAVEYPFWSERKPEALLRFGSAICTEKVQDRAPAQWTSQIALALEQTMDGLAKEACSQDPTLFDSLITGKTGVGGVFDLWRRLVSCIRCRRFRPEHLPSEGEQS